MSCRWARSRSIELGLATAQGLGATHGPRQLLDPTGHCGLVGVGWSCTD